jgi:hypothetical protein
MAIGTNEDILWFEVTINDACCMQAFDALHNFGRVKPGPISA